MAFNEVLGEHPLGEDLRKTFAAENGMELFPRLKGLKQ